MFRTAVFIDNGYISKILKNHFGEPSLDYEKFSNNLCKENEDRLRTYVYMCMPYQSNPPTSKESQMYADADRFKSALEKLPRFEIKLGKLQKIGNIFKQKMVDILLSVDLVQLCLSRQIQTAILVAGDRDYVPAVKAAKDAGTLIRLFYKEPIHDQLRKECDEPIEITENLIQNSLRH